MTPAPPPRRDAAARRIAQLEAQVAETSARLAEAEETLRAIRSGEVDALVVEGPEGDSVYTLVGAERPYRLLVETMNEGAVTIDAAGVVLYCNLRFAEMLGRDLENVMGSSIQDRIVPESRGAFDAVVRAARAGAAKGEVLLDGAARGEIPVQLSAAPVPTSAEVLGLVVTDLSELESLRRAIRAREDFLSIASHELKTPLSALMLTVDALRRVAEKDAALPARFVANLRAAFRQGTRLAQLMNDLLDVSRLDAGRLELALGNDVDLSAVAREVTDRLLPEARRARSEVELRAPSPVLGRWDRNRLERVVTNLVANAIKYGAGAPVTIEVTQDGDGARLTVADRGIGIAPEHQAHIFERLERAPNAREFGGLGLGLWIAREIVVLHGGTIHVESRVGHGALFVVDLPRGVR
jgi:PAS domain S-box-containing protein